MILYKYYGASAGISAIESKKLGFREPSYFNDPFDLTYINNSSLSNELNRLVAYFKNYSVILSLTRNPLNPLMWAHYGAEHKGFCIGYDVDDDFLLSKGHNLIPVSSGDVTYTSVKEQVDIDSDFSDVWRDLISVSNAENIDAFISDNKNLALLLLKKMLLYKHSAWSYEEEVRVIKIHRPLLEEIGTEDGNIPEGHFLSHEYNWSNPMANVDGLWLYDHPVKIKEIYCGLRSEVDEAQGALLSSVAADGVKVFKVDMLNGSWMLGANQNYE